MKIINNLLKFLFEGRGKSLLDRNANKQYQRNQIKGLVIFTVPIFLILNTLLYRYGLEAMALIIAVIQIVLLIAALIWFNKD